MLKLIDVTGEVAIGKDATFRYPEHTYILNDSKPRKLIGYVIEGTEKEIFFSRPLAFDRSRRKFKEIYRG